MVPGVGTLVNVVAVLVGTSVGVLLGHRLPERTRGVVTDGLGLVTLLIAGASAASVLSPAAARSVGAHAPMLIVLGSVLLGGILGSLLRVEDRLEDFGGWLRRRLVGADAGEGRARFVQGYVTSSLIFCVGPLTFLGSLTEGLGGGPDQLLLKSALDLFAAMAFAASFGWGVAASAVSLIVVQGGMTLLGFVAGNVLDGTQVALLDATGGVVLAGLAIRLLALKQVPVGDLLPALLVAPVLTVTVAALH